MKILNKTAKILKIKALFVCIVLIFCSVNVFGQSITWQRIINNNYSNYNKVIQTRDNFFIAVGFDKVNTVDFLVVSKFDFYGNEIWHIEYGSENSEGYWVEETTDNKYIICGRSDSKYYLIKIDTNGSLIWEKRFTYGFSDMARCVKQTIDNKYIVAGYVYNNMPGTMFLKTDSLGNLINQKVYLNTNTEFIYEILETGNSYWAIGSRFINNGDVLLTKLDNNLDTIFTKNYGGSNLDIGYSIDKIVDQGFILGGISRSFNQSNKTESYIIRIDTNANIVWQNTYAGTYNERIKSIRFKSSIGILTTGSVDSVNNISNAKLRLLNLNGDIIGEKKFLPGTLGAGFESVEFTSDNGSISAGYVTYSGGFEKMYIVKTDSLLHADPIGLVNISTEIPKAFQLFQNYPNPFNSSTYIKFQIIENSDVKIIIYDALGKQINKYEFGEIKTGTYFMNWDANNFASGIYFYKIISKNFNQSKKMVLLK